MPSLKATRYSVFAAHFSFFTSVCRCSRLFCIDFTRESALAAGQGHSLGRFDLRVANLLFKMPVRCGCNPDFVIVKIGDI